VRIRFVLSSVLAVVLAAALAAPAGAQTLSTGSSPLRAMNFNAGDPAVPPDPATRPAFNWSMTPAPRQGGDMPVVVILLGGFNTSGSFGFAAGGGVQLLNISGREEFAIQIDGLFSDVGGCSGCGVLADFDATQLAFAGAFLYKFKRAASGWQPFAGGGIVITRYDFSVNGFDCDFPGSPCGTRAGLQVQGGVAKEPWHFEGRIYNTVQGSFVGLVGYKFGQRR
jgi:hypothetical protein